MEILRKWQLLEGWSCVSCVFAAGLSQCPGRRACRSLATDLGKARATMRQSRSATLPVVMQLIDHGCRHCWEGSNLSVCKHTGNSTCSYSQIGTATAPTTLPKPFASHKTSHPSSINAKQNANNLLHAQPNPPPTLFPRIHSHSRATLPRNFAPLSYIPHNSLPPRSRLPL